MVAYMTLLDTVDRLLHCLHSSPSSSAPVCLRPQGEPLHNGRSHAAVHPNVCLVLQKPARTCTFQHNCTSCAAASAASASNGSCKYLMTLSARKSKLSPSKLSAASPNACFSQTKSHVAQSSLGVVLPLET